MNKKKNILIIDDDPDLRQGLEHALEKEGYIVRSGESISACYQQLKTKKPDILLLDVVLPDGDGIELANELATNSKYAGMGIMLMSGMRKNNSDKEIGLSQGVLHYAIKPFQIDELKERLKLIFKVKDLENKHQRLEEHYNSLFNQVADIMFVLDSNGDLINLSPSYSTITGIKQQDQLSKPFKDLIINENHTNWNHNFEKASNNRIVASFEIFLVNAFENPIPVEVQLTKSKGWGTNGFVILGIAKDMRLQKLFDSQKEQRYTNNIERQKQEISSWEKMSKSSTQQTSNAYELNALQDTSSQLFINLIKGYQKLIDSAVEQRIYKVKIKKTEQHQLFASELGFLKAGPRDLIRIHTHLFKYLTKELNPKKMTIYHEESRLILLSIMGYLVSFYKNNNTSSS